MSVVISTAPEHLHGMQCMHPPTVPVQWPQALPPGPVFRAKMPKPISLALNHCFRKKKSLLVKSVKYAGPVQCQNIFYVWNKSLPVKSEDYFDY